MYLNFLKGAKLDMVAGVKNVFIKNEMKYGDTEKGKQ